MFEKNAKVLAWLFHLLARLEEVEILDAEQSESSFSTLIIKVTFKK